MPNDNRGRGGTTGAFVVVTGGGESLSAEGTVIALRRDGGDAERKDGEQSRDRLPLSLSLTLSSAV